MGTWLCFEDVAGQRLRPPKGRTWGRRGRAPVVRVTAAGTKRVSMAALHQSRPPASADLPHPPCRGRVVAPEEVAGQTVGPVLVHRGATAHRIGHAADIAGGRRHRCVPSGCGDAGDRADQAESGTVDGRPGVPRGDGTAARSARRERIRGRQPAAALLARRCRRHPAPGTRHPASGTRTSPAGQLLAVLAEQMDASPVRYGDPPRGSIVSITRQSATTTG